MKQRLWLTGGVTRTGQQGFTAIQMSLHMLQQWGDANDMWRDCKEQPDTERISQAVATTKVLMRMADPGMEFLVEWLNDLGIWLLERHDVTQSVDELDFAVDISRLAVDTSRGLTLSRATCSGNLGNVLVRRFEHGRLVDHLHQAVHAYSEAVDNTPTHHSNRTVWSGLLAQALSMRYDLSPSPLDLNRAIELYSTAIESATSENVPRMKWTDDLALCLGKRFEQRKSIDDLNHTIEIIEATIAISPPDSPDLSTRRIRHGIWLGERYVHSQVASDLDCMLDDFEEALRPGRSTSSAIQASDTARMMAYLDERIIKMISTCNQDESIRLLKLALAAGGQEHPKQLERLLEVAYNLRARYETSSSFKDLEECIETQRQSLDLLSEGNPHRVNTLIDLSDSLHDKYYAIKLLQDMDDSISISRQAIALASLDPGSYSSRAGWMFNLGIRLQIRHEESKRIADLNESIQLLREAIEITPHENPDRLLMLTHLGTGLARRFVAEQNEADLEESIQMARLALSESTEHNDKVKAMSNLADRLRDRYEQKRDFPDLQESIKHAQRAVDISSSEHPHWVRLLAGLANRLKERFHLLGKMEDIDMAIEVARQALEATPSNHPDRSTAFCNLGNALQARSTFLGLEDTGDIDEAVEMSRQALASHSNDHGERSTHLINLSIRLLNRHTRTGHTIDLEEAIRLTREGLPTIPQSHQHWPRWTSHLGLCLLHRYLEIRATEDLKASIDLFRQGINASSKNEPQRVNWMLNLSGSLSEMYSREKSLCNMEEAIELLRRVLMASISNDGRAATLSNLGRLLNSMYRKTGETIYLEESTSVTRKALDLTPTKSPRRAIYLGNLALDLQRRYRNSENLEDLQEAIECARAALKDSADTEGQPEETRLTFNLGVILGTRSVATHSWDDMKEAMTCFLSTLNNVNTSTTLRIESGIELLTALAHFKYWDDASRIAKEVVGLAPRLTGKSLDNADKQHLLRSISGLACDAAAIALQAEESPDTALELLEEGRGVLAASLYDMRTDTIELQRAHPKLADRFVRLRDQLQTDSAMAAIPFGDFPPTAPAEQSDQRYYAGTEMDNVITEIRAEPGFEGFLKPLESSKLREAAIRGPIAVINVSRHRCDALLVEQHQIRVLPLPALTLQDIRKAAETGALGTSEILNWLWETVTCPVLDDLGFNKPVDGHWPRMWWIPTGLLSKFPLHAAGKLTQDSTCTVLSRVMSSYNSSLRSIINARQQDRSRTISAKPERALVVAMPITPHQGALQFAGEEADLVRNLCKSMEGAPVMNQPRKREVLVELQQSSIFHFAGHGETHFEDPSQSNLLLDDWQTDPLTVADLLRLDLREQKPFLAYLSACGTSEIRVQQLFDESLHLVSACQLAGFRHVIGTLWAVNDERCLHMAGETYEEILREGLTDESVCLGLHKAAFQLQSEWLRSSHAALDGSYNRAKMTRKYVTAHPVVNETTCSDSRLPRDVYADDSDTQTPEPLHWVPYVHFGV
ncbi:CHAT domain-containing protein [Boeremia exigua]|uniref:CHAT domain-containing protein n=1 Tax=Boeremia exigua TaxID=749465 RepID=UPI001E8EE64E|nr:CHAT domain-containing protein [Boeremia exigua]KAH6641967.1 CHAT domain-containing protein [Boeremia exigua]